MLLRKATNGTEGNFMAFQGKQRIKYNLIRPHGSVLPLMLKS